MLKMKNVKRVVFMFLFIFIFQQDVQSKDPCDLHATVNRYNKLMGFHSELHTVIEITAEQPNLWNNCSVLVEENLPASVFVNPDELAELLRFGDLEACPEGFIDIELPAYKATPSKVHLYSELIKQSNLLITRIPPMPFHARYQAPVPGGGYVNVKLLKPSVFVRCQDLSPQCMTRTIPHSLSCSPCSTEKCLWHQIAFEESSEPISFEVPVGNTDLQPFVQYITFFATCLGCVYIMICILGTKQLKHQKES